MRVGLQELAGYTGGDASFLKEDFELQFNKHLFLDSVGPRHLPLAARCSQDRSLHPMLHRPSRRPIPLPALSLGQTPNEIKTQR